MRGQFETLVEELIIPTLYGVSALGTRLCVYTYDKETRALQPERIDEDPKRVNNRASTNRWDLDIMASTGEQRIRKLVARVIITAMCAGL
jgi:hypothetical protein